jgi:HPt (histidine-containing phosphotransfer) domain-containing protein
MHFPNHVMAFPSPASRTSGPGVTIHRLHVDIPSLMRGTDSRDRACTEYAEGLARLAVVRSAAIWMRDLSQESFRLIHAVPECPGVDRLDANDPLSRWAIDSGAFSWRVSLEETRTGHEGVCLYFSQEGRLILKLVSAVDDLGESDDIRCVQYSLAELFALLDSASSTPGAGDRPSGAAFELSVDLQYLRATAMGDDEFVRHILVLCADELEIAVEQLAAAAEKMDVDAVAYIAHRMRSTARTAGIENLDNVLALAETAAMNGRVRGCDTAVEFVQAAVQSIRRLLNTL